MMSVATKSAQLQIRVSPAEKAAIERAARRAGLDMSAYVLERVFPRLPGRFVELVEGCHKSERFGLAELSSWLAALSSAELRDAVASPPAPGATPYLANYVAAMVEYACARRNIPPPPWTREIAPLAEPVFGSTLMSLRLHLLTHSPPPFRRRNIFIDSTVGARAYRWLRSMPGTFAGYSISSTRHCATRGSRVNCSWWVVRSCASPILPVLPRRT